ncbi:hypothetical protein AA0120_g8257 [Alternaria tenuissima]|jgi:hypothetical protein|uniref:Uncharacterized protein n=1 Tax=Alternaria tenuissima TaxID=119927 RepID=A0A4Q4MXQ1_9PLEO|nr:hypothetical protein AA0114_g483 [Alternaria tenuissima]RYN86248.1 hypothetical protein AA0120_g8257 [Alternaria tenuissima]
MKANDSSKFTSADGNIIYPFPDDIHVKNHVSLQKLDGEIHTKNSRGAGGKTEGYQKDQNTRIKWKLPDMGQIL